MFWAYVFVSPWLVGLVVFILGPMLFSLFLSFFNYTLGREFTCRHFAGLDNWIRAFTKDELFWPSVGKTFCYAVDRRPAVSVFGALLTAMLLNQGLRGMTFYRTVFFMPHLVADRRGRLHLALAAERPYGLVNEIIFQVAYRTGNGWVGPN